MTVQQENIAPPGSNGAVPFELELLANALNYQRWVADSINPFLGSRILEVGAGTGNMAKWLPLRDRLVLSEADASLLPMLKTNVEKAFKSDSRVSVRHLDLSTDWVESFAQENFDTIVSFNVLEHIEDDRKAIGDLLKVLQKSKAPGPRRLISFVPAHQWAFGEMDRQFGHFRRYSASTFSQLVSSLLPGAKFNSRYFNLAGLPSWFFMGRILRRKEIGPAAVHTFEKICPYIRGFDDFLHTRLGIGLGQSLLCSVEIPLTPA